MDSGFRRNDQEVQVHVISAKAGIQTTRRSTVLPDLLRSYAFPNSYGLIIVLSLLQEPALLRITLTFGLCALR